MLERLVWRLVRNWSTDWVRNPNQQVQRVLTVVAAAATPAPTSVAEPTPVPSPRYAKYGDVPSSAAHSALLTVLGDYGITEYRDVLKAASSKLGLANGSLDGRCNQARWVAR